MPLTCGCDFDTEYAWYYAVPSDYTVMPERKRRARCQSCSSLIGTGDITLVFPRGRPANCDYEIARFGEEHDSVPLSPHYLCETCGDLFLSLTELGFCVSPEEDQRELVKEYAEQR